MKLPNAGDGDESVRARYTADRLLEDDFGCQARKGNESCVVVIAVVDEAGGTNEPFKDINTTNNNRRVFKFVWFVESNKHHRNQKHGDMDEVECFVEPPTDVL